MHAGGLRLKAYPHRTNLKILQAIQPPPGTSRLRLHVRKGHMPNLATRRHDNVLRASPSLTMRQQRHLGDTTDVMYLLTEVTSPDCVSRFTWGPQHTNYTSCQVNKHIHLQPVGRETGHLTRAPEINSSHVNTGVCLVHNTSQPVGQRAHGLPRASGHSTPC